MNKFIISIIRFSLATVVLMLGCITPTFGADLQMFSNARLIDNPSNDGDSFFGDFGDVGSKTT